MDLFDFALSIARIGGAAVVVLVIVLGFLMLVQKGEIPERKADLFKFYLKLGFASAVVVLGASLAPVLLGSDGDTRVPRTFEMAVTVSPSLTAAKLPGLDMALMPRGTQVTEGVPFRVDADSTLKVTADSTINAAKAIQQVVQAQSSTIDQLATKLEAAATQSPTVSVNEAQLARIKTQNAAISRDAGSGRFRSLPGMSRAITANVRNLEVTSSNQD